MKQLPTEHDFDPYGGDLDAQWAWRNFGGVSLDSAIKKFREKPDCYQEDFMSMGGAAFAYYFPAIETYLLETPETYGGDDRCVWILAHCIKNQFQMKTNTYVLPLIPRIQNLIQYVRKNVDRFEDEESGKARIIDAWMELETEIMQNQ
jgi:hypothetical protein